MQIIEDTLTQISRDLEQTAQTLAVTRASIERCEALPSVSTQNLLKLQVRCGKALEH